MQRLQRRGTRNNPARCCGVLAFHGDTQEHLVVLRILGADGIEVRTLGELDQCPHLILPGGESTVMAKFLWESGMARAIRARAKRGLLALYGTCAGAILLADRATGAHPPKTLGILPITVERNAYGSQMQSFAARLSVRGIPKPFTASFIRAPVITRVGPGAQILARHAGVPVLVARGRILAGTFHPELRGETAIHRMFLSL